ncbi:hypothetical protein SK128_009335, partial [Halocaridina rubra]
DISFNLRTYTIPLLDVSLQEQKFTETGTTNLLLSYPSQSPLTKQKKGLKYDQDKYKPSSFLRMTMFNVSQFDPI